MSSTSEAEGKRTYGLEFIDWLGLLSRLPPALREIFNQRGDHRVEPDPGHPVESTVHVPGRDAGIQVEVLDISSMGVSFVIDREAEAALQNPETLELSIRLPAGTETLDFKATVLEWNVVPEGARCRAFFLEEATDGFEERQELLAAYVAARRRELLGLLDGAEPTADAKSRVDAAG